MMMMVEDLFTLAEIKDGLKSPGRVKELMTLIQKEKDSVGEASNSTQWDTVAHIIAVTESKDCLDLFVELDGLWFIKRWLKDAYKFGNESGIQDSTVALLTALDRLQIDKSRLVRSGILTSVLELVGHDDSVVHEKAKALCDKWMRRKQDDETNSLVPISPSWSSDDDDETNSLEVARKVDSRGGIESPDSRNGKESLRIGGGSTKLASSGPGPGPEAMRVNHGETTLGSVSEVAQESEANTERCFSGFDLNQEGGSQEIEPVLQFEGNLGWKGSGAFRRIAECGTSSNSKQRSDSLNIDLNVAEDSEDTIELRNKNPIISRIPSGEESSIEASPRRSVRLHLDLNSLGDGSVDNVVLNQNGRPSPSQSSSSSIMQPSTRNIDLNSNEHSSFPNDAFPNQHNLFGNLFNNPTASRGVDESAISLFATIVEDAIPQPPNPRMLELGLGRSGGGWAVGSSTGVYGHNGFPYMYFSSPYGPVGAPTPYMVDPRGGVPPQFVGSSSAQPPAPGQQPPAFLMDMAGGGSQQNVDLMMNGGNREVLNDDYDGGQSSWVVGGKRQEPDGGWDGFSGDYKHQQPPWKRDP